MTEIDILRMELEENLPYWLSPEAKLKGKLEPKLKATREKHRARRREELQREE